jgi:hypothetical protein
MVTWTEVFGPPDPPPFKLPKEVKTPRCQGCGRFTSKLHPIYAGWPMPDILWEAGDCCFDKTN